MKKLCVLSQILKDTPIAINRALITTALRVSAGIVMFWKNGDRRTLCFGQEGSRTSWAACGRLGD